MSESKAKTPHGEMTLDQLAEVQPGMAKLMKEVGERYSEAYYAAKGGNWKLAAYHLNQVRGTFRIAKVTRPKFADDLAAFDKEYLTPIFKAIQERSWESFETAFRKGIDGSDVYHDKTGYPFIRYVLPETHSSKLFLGPPEKFSRNTGAKE